MEEHNKCLGGFYLLDKGFIIHHSLGGKRKRCFLFKCHGVTREFWFTRFRHIISYSSTNKLIFDPVFWRRISYVLIIPKSLLYWIPPPGWSEHLHDHQIVFYRSTALSHKGQQLWYTRLAESEWSITRGVMLKCLTAQRRWGDYFSLVRIWNFMFLLIQNMEINSKCIQAISLWIYIIYYTNES